MKYQNTNPEIFEDILYLCFKQFEKLKVKFGRIQLKNRKEYCTLDCYSIHPNFH